MAEIYRSSSISCRSTHVTDDILVISIVFEATPDLDRAGLLSGECAKGGYSALDILLVRRFPFPADEVAGLLAAAHAFTRRYRRVVVYGFSLGGYAALNFAPLLGARVAIASSPLFSPDPAKVPFERRWKGERTRLASFPWDNMVHALKALDEIYLMYDPHDSDGEHMKAIVDVAPGAVLLPVPFGGHPVASVLSVQGVTFEFIADIAHERFDPRKFRTAARTARRASARYFENLARMQPDSRDGLRIRLLERGLRFQKRARPGYLMQLIGPLVRQGRQAEAQSFADRAVRAGAAPEAVEALLHPPRSAEAAV